MPKTSVPVSIGPDFYGKAMLAAAVAFFLAMAVMDPTIRDFFAAAIRPIGDALHAIARI